MLRLRYEPLLSFTVDGEPATKGSVRAVVSKSTKRPIVKSTGSKGLGHWTQRIATEAQAHMDGRALLDGAIEASFVFTLPRPKSKPKREQLPRWKPDPDKLARAAMDALKGIVYTDDARSCDLHVKKRYVGQHGGATKPGVHVTIREIVVEP